MANKTTTQEVDGGNLTTDDLFRIARGGTNYKLESSNIFMESITVNELATRATSNNLVPGRKYTITDAGSSGNTSVVITATSSGTYSTANHFTGSGANTSGSFVSMNQGLGAINCVIDSNGNIIQNANYSFEGSKSLITGVGYFNATTGGGLFTSHVIGGGFQLGANSITNSTITNSTIVYDNSLVGISGCTITDCTIQLINGASLSGCTIIGSGVSSCSYVFDAATLSNQTIIAGKYSSAEYSLRNGIDFNPGTKTLTLPANTNWVGTFLLDNFTGSETLEFIDGNTNSFQYHTPVKFKNNSGVLIQTIHINDPGSNLMLGQLMYPHHHGNNDDLNTNYSYLLGTFDAANNVWPIIEYIDYV